jgi:hypothetical protein
MIQRTIATTIVGRQKVVSSSMRGSPTMAFPHGRLQSSLAAKRRAMATPNTTRGLLLLPKTPLQLQLRVAPTSSVPEWYHRPMARWLSSEIRSQTAAVAAANASIAAEKAASASGNGAAKKKDEPNLFLDHLGKIFLIGIATLIGTLIRSSYNTSNRNTIRDHLEDVAAIDPKELEEFREANSELTIDTMRQLLSIYYQEHARISSGDSGFTSSYDEFVITIRRIMATRFPKFGDSFTIQTGHYLDRIVVAILEQRGEGASVTENHELPVALFFAAMASAMNGSVSDRVRILHEILLMEEEQQQQQVATGMDFESSSDSSSSNNGAVPVNSIPLTSVRNMVGYLQESCQLPPDTQIVPTERKYPTQLWRRATPGDMVPDISGIDTDNDSKNDNGGDADRGDADRGVDLVEFAAILRTKSVCAWGECYMRVKPDASEFEESNQGPPKALSSIAN